jgi:hypothetical protein
LHNRQNLHTPPGAIANPSTPPGSLDRRRRLQGNEIQETRHMPVNLGGIYQGCSTPPGAGAIRFFGQHHDIRSN